MRSIATVGFIGYLPAPGTMGTLVALPCAYVFTFLTFSYQVSALLILHCLGLFIIDRALPEFAQSDPKEIVLDEFIGTLVTFTGIIYSPIIFCIGFFLFRLLDIFKPLGIKYIEKLPGAFGILFDDSFAGFFTNLILRYLIL